LFYHAFDTYCRFWNIIGEREIDAVWKPNEDFCHIVVDTGMFDHHVPDSVVNAVDRLYNQYTSGKGKSCHINAPTVAQQQQHEHTSNTTIGLQRQVTMQHIDTQPR